MAGEKLNPFKEAPEISDKTWRGSVIYALRLLYFHHFMCESEYKKINKRIKEWLKNNEKE